MQVKDIQRLLHKYGGEIISFEISDEKVNSEDATIYYYGYLANNGAWIIQENDTGEGTYRYIAGSSGYEANWAARQALSYGLFNTVTIGE